MIEIELILKSGYAGTLSNGNIVDRREYQEATPIRKNKLMGSPKPKKIPKLVHGPYISHPKCKVCNKDVDHKWLEGDYSLLVCSSECLSNYKIDKPCY